MVVVIDWKIKRKIIIGSLALLSLYLFNWSHSLVAWLMDFQVFDHEFFAVKNIVAIVGIWSVVQLHKNRVN